LKKNQQQLETAKDFKEQMYLMEVHNSLKTEERKITQLLGTVIIK
jgi:hypothetical protein